VEIEWEPPSDNGGMPVTGYKVQSANYDTYIFTSVDCLKDGVYSTVLTAETHVCLNDRAYLCTDGKCKYRVLAINGIEDDNFADVSPYLVASAASLPSPPTEVTRDNPPVTQTAIEVSWSAVVDLGLTGGSLVTGYRVYANTG
jgi:hypothetical protein